VGLTAPSREATTLLRRGAGVLAVIAGVVVVTLAAGSLLMYRQRDAVIQEAVGFVDAVADFRTSQIERWLAERRGDALVASRDQVLARAIEHAPAADLEQAARARMALISTSYGYEAIVAVDRQGARRLGVGSDVDLAAGGLAARAQEAMTTGRLQIVGPRRLGGERLAVDLVVPLLADSGGDWRCVGALVLRVDPTGVFAEILGVSAGASRSGELALVARTDGETLFIHPKRRGTKQPWLAAAPPGGPRTAEALVARGATDLSSAIDDAGEAVIAAGRPIRGLDAHFVGHIASHELLGTARRALFLTVGLLGVLFLAAGLFARHRWTRRTRSALLANEEKFKIIFETMQDAYLLAKLEGEILMVNPAAVRMLGYESEAHLVGKSMQTDIFVYPEDRASLKQRLATEPDGVLGHKATFRRADGGHLIVEGNVRLVRDEQGAPFAIEGVVRDMTAHYQIRNDLIAARQAAETATQTKAQFLANMSHEIRTPLNAIVGLGHLLRRAQLPAAERDRVDKIQASARMLLGIVEDVLDFSRIEAGKLQLESTPFDLDRVLADVAGVLSIQAAAKGVALESTVAPDVPRALVGDPLRLTQVLMNLMGNGLKFTDSGRVAVAVSLGERAGANAVLKFAVTDTGIGIPASQLTKIFEPFVQADGTSTRRYGGSGLGLAICRQVVEAMGGSLHASSTPGVGSTFSFTARLDVSPLAQAGRPVPVASADEDLRALRGARVLLVEDNPINQQVARELLESVGVTVLIADNGAAAVAAVEGGPPADVVLMDLQMPQMDGLRATRAIRARPEHAGLPIVAMTAHALASEREACMAAGMNDYLVKPFEPAQLYEVVARRLTGRGPAPAASPSAAAVELDVEAALHRVGGDRALLHRLLDQLARDFADAPARIAAGVARGARDEARDLAHTLKGTGATLGAGSLAQAAGEVEDEIARGATDLAASLARLDERLAATRARIVVEVR
jgi:PAS domain S-box-containing protein